MTQLIALYALMEEAYTKVACISIFMHLLFFFFGCLFFCLFLRTLFLNYLYIRFMGFVYSSIAAELVTCLPCVCVRIPMAKHKNMT